MSTIGYSLARQLCSVVHTFSRRRVYRCDWSVRFQALDEWVLNCTCESPPRDCAAVREARTR